MSDKLLNTREAARLLRVSEASVRRWANAGLLPTSRVGPRGARRFTEEDLLSFMAPPEAGPSRSPAGWPRAIKVHGMAIGMGSHLASFYANDGGRFRQALPFLLDGLTAHQACLLYAEPRVIQQYAAALRQERVDLDETTRSGAVRILPAHPCTPEEWIAEVEAVVTDISRRHPGPVRFLGEGASGARSVGSTKSLCDMEHLATALAKRFPMVILCPYDVREFDGPSLLEVLKLHYDTFMYEFGFFLS